MFSAARRAIENAHQDDTTKRDGGANLLRRPFAFIAMCYNINRVV